MPFGRPVSALVVHETGSFAGAHMLRFLLGSGRTVSLRYAGDRLWPGIPDGSALVVEPLGAGSPQRGEAVVAIVDGVPDVFRVHRTGDPVLLVADADPAPPRAVAATDVIGRVGARPRWPLPGPLRRLTRAALALGEAATGQVDTVDDPARSVRETDHLATLAALLPPGGRVLVVGREGLVPEPVAGDVREIDVAGTFDAIVFTPDVYSFLPGSEQRRVFLRRIAPWLAPGGRVFLSAREERGAWTRLLLAVLWMAPSPLPREWGDSHTRWPGSDGRLHRSYVHLFTRASLGREIRRAGWSEAPRVGGWRVLVPER